MYEDIVSQLSAISAATPDAFVGSGAIAAVTLTQACLKSVATSVEAASGLDDVAACILLDGAADQIVYTSYQVTVGLAHRGVESKDGFFRELTRVAGAMRAISTERSGIILPEDTENPYRILA